ncbi:MAG TPA: prohibitin family protein [Candidatus Paceibacterota bacterium]|nr:prohibitin family protein [Candidatus Pacearchaeota archaeon]HRZ50454.1 prohibitin family protein [Candidatus Paceibacterota bacterium]HSA36175.1 prohibitin family protein [Candidatus Paceibacterota bacterium]
MSLGGRGTASLLGILVILGAFVVMATVEIIEPGYEGVYYKLGTVEDKPLPSGWNYIAPWGHVIPFELKQLSHEYTKIEGTLTKEGLSVTPDVSIIYRIKPGSSVGIYKNVSGSYFDTLITPIFMYVLRDEIKRWTAEDIYTGKASEIQADVQKRLQEYPTLVKEGIILDQVLIRGVVLPDEVVKAIEAKIKRGQEVETMKFSVLVQQQENLKILSAAEAQAKANQMVANSITPTLVQYKYVEAIASNPNTVIIGGGGNGMMLNAAELLKNG